MVFFWSSLLDLDWTTCSSVLVTLVLGISLSKLHQRYKNYVHFVKLANALPGTALKNHPHPWLADIGTVLNLPKVGDTQEPNLFEYQCQMATKYEKEGLFRRWQYNPHRLPFLAKSRTVIFDPELIQDMLLRSKSFPEKSISYVHAEPLFRDSLISMPDGDEWKRQRRLASPGFSHVVLENVTCAVFKLLHQTVFPRWDDSTNTSTTDEKKHHHTNNSNGSVENHTNGIITTNITTKGGGRDINMKSWMHPLALDILALAAFSTSLGTTKVLAEEDQKKASNTSATKNNTHDSSTTTRSGCSGDEHLSQKQLLYKSKNPLVYAINIMTIEMQTRVRVPLRATIMKLFRFTKTARAYFDSCQVFNDAVVPIVISRMTTNQQQEQEQVVTPPPPPPHQEKEQVEHADLLSSLIGESFNGYKLPFQNIYGNTRMFFFAGSDTTSYTLSFAMWYVAKHPHVQQKMHQELDPLFQEKDSPLHTLGKESYNILKKLPYLDAVVKETLRLSPAAPIERQAVHDTVLRTKSGDREYTIPQGMTCVCMPFLTHRHSDYWESPTEFVPERFLTSDYSIPPQDNDDDDDNSADHGPPRHGEEPTTKHTPPSSNKIPKKYHPQQYMPFSVGPRSCIGKYLASAELRAVLAQVVYHYDLTPSKYQTNEPGYVFGMTIGPDQVKVCVKRRKPSN
eukprot:CAMPEP_0195288448 /NCGR_PEP_ID=MMETSP0707-20130614/5111_1 /TAXON_ID=33640 /ORGANISM="Asterionellopsis glacialis, Strain CCMP134" /LENGTH=679 /DNA_ID=CAMNT_0040348319 /DNA_START=89 /DNA_END=2131 /DNA_ORIENTATION=+